MPVHLYGQACDILALQDICRRHSLLLIEDAAQAHGAQVNGRCVGSFGDLACFSFYPGKNLGAFGEGGAVVTNKEQIADRIRRLRDHAQDGRHHHVELGYNARMEGIQGAVLNVKLPYLDSWNLARRRHADQYRELLADVPWLQLPASQQPDAHVWHLFVVLIQGADRNELQAHLRERGIASAIHYPTPAPLQPAYAHLGHQSGDFPIAEDVMKRCLSLPIYPEMTFEQIRHVCQAMREIL
jgi:dTDP-4-amino-4,6-dideoxygalactose transaminase